MNAVTRLMRSPVRSIAMVRSEPRRGLSLSAQAKRLLRYSGSPLGSSLLTSLAVLSLNAVTGLLLARTLGPRGRGELAAAILWPNLLVTVGALGLVDATTYFVARSPSSLRALVRTTFVISVVQSIVLTALGALIVPLALAHYGSSVVHSGELFLLYIPLFFLMQYPVSLLQGLERFRAMNLARLLGYLPVAVGFGALAVAGRLTVWTAVYTYLGTAALAALATVLMLRHQRRAPEEARASFDRGLGRGLFGFGIRMHVGNITVQLAQWLDQVVISLVLASTQLGLFVVASAMKSLTMIFSWAVSLVLMPRIARLEPGRERAAAAARYLRLTLLASVALVVPLLIAVPQLLRLLFGNPFAAAATPARVLVVASIPLALGQVVATLLSALGRPLEAGVAQGVGLITTLGALAVLVPLFGILGAAIASLLGACVGTGVLLRRTRQALGERLVDLLAPSRIEAAAEAGGGSR